MCDIKADSADSDFEPSVPKSAAPQNHPKCGKKQSEDVLQGQEMPRNRDLALLPVTQSVNPVSQEKDVRAVV